MTAAAVPLPFAVVARSVALLESEEIERLPAASLADLLRGLGSLDVRARGPRGMQTDFAVRGGSFAQTLVLIDGVRMNDAQTAHHNGDIPLPLGEVERIEVLHGPGSALHGADAFAGIVNVVTRRDRPGLRGSLSAGSHGYAAGELAGGFGEDARHLGLHGSLARSDGFAEERGFESFGLGARALAGSARLHASHVDKDFGAAGFYGPAPSHERTQQTLLHARHSAPLAPGWELETQAGFRRHGDRFVYDARRTALFAARHLTHALNAAAKLHWRSASGHRLSLGAEGGRDWIDSSSLGDHADARAAGFVELQRPLARRAQLHAGLRLDGYERYGSAWSPSLAAVGWLSSDLRLQASLGRSFRVPTYTELFYADPNHEASNSLGPESAWSGDLGADWGGRRGLGAGLTAFARGERNVVDWVRSTPQERWRTANIHRIRAAGLEAWLAWSRPTWKLEAGWAFTSVDSDEQDRLTKYVSDYARHSLRLRATAEPGSWLLGERTVFKRYADGRAFCLVDLRVARALGRFRPYLELTNLLDADWQEIRGVEQPGRGVELGLQFRK